MSSITCILCNKELSAKGISSHLRRQHKISNKEYYDAYLKKENAGICPICGKETKFDSIFTGYRTYCSTKCLNLDPNIRAKIEQTSIERYGVKCNLNLEETKQKAIRNSQSKEAIHKRIQTNLERYGTENVYASEYVKTKIKETMQTKYGVDYAWQAEEIKQKMRETRKEKYGKETYANTELSNYIRNKHREEILANGYTYAEDLYNQYGTGWYQSGLIQTHVFYGKAYVKNEDIPLIIDYYNSKHTAKSFYEDYIVDYIKSFYNGNIRTNYRKIIPPYELDIFLPEFQLAIEFNGRYWHSIDHGCDKDYHLNKSLLCRNKNVRLIHIYEFEDFDEQLNLLKNLILGIDNYPKNDFNKNNLLNKIPESTIIYNNNYIVYGAGQLMKGSE